MVATRIAVMLAALAAACTSSPEPKLLQAEEPRLPDLVVSGSCRRAEDVPTLVVAVSNRGRGAASPSTTRVQFDDFGAAVARRMPYIPAGAVATFEIPAPAACMRADCRWRATANSGNDVSETDEANNTFHGRC